MRNVPRGFLRRCGVQQLEAVTNGEIGAKLLAFEARDAPETADAVSPGNARRAERRNRLDKLGPG